MSKLLKILALASMFSISSTVFAEPPDDVGTGKPCPECATITTSPAGADDTVPDDVGTGSGKPTLAAWWELLFSDFQKY